MNANQWHNIALVYTGIEQIAYYNGVEDSRVVAPVISDGRFPLFIGSSQASLIANNFFDGQVADVRIYNRALSRFEIAQLASRRGIAYELDKPRRSFFAFPKVPPTLLSANTNAAGNTLTLTFDKAVNETDAIGWSLTRKG